MSTNIKFFTIFFHVHHLLIVNIDFFNIQYYFSIRIYCNTMCHVETIKGTDSSGFNWNVREINAYIIDVEIRKNKYFSINLNSRVNQI